VIQFAKCRNLSQWRLLHAGTAGVRPQSAVVVKHGDVNTDTSVQQAAKPSVSAIQTIFSFPSIGTLEVESPIVTGPAAKTAMALRPRSASATRRSMPLSGSREKTSTSQTKHTFGRVIEPKLAYTAKPAPTKAEIVQQLEPTKLDLRPASRALTKCARL
jgi:hypothetical protein